MYIHKQIKSLRDQAVAFLRLVTPPSLTYESFNDINLHSMTNRRRSNSSDRDRDRDDIESHRNEQGLQLVIKVSQINLEVPFSRINLEPKSSGKCRIFISLLPQLSKQYTATFCTIFEYLGMWDIFCFLSFM